MYKVTLEVSEVRGECVAGHKVGDKVVINERGKECLKADNICLYALGDILPYVIALYRDTAKEDWINNLEYIYCSDDAKVVFKVQREKI